MENLTKQQIVLLTLFVSFVTSMATGIFTVSLMDQAPQGVTQTINRVVERTVERVVPAETAPATVIKSIPYEDTIAIATQKSTKSLVQIIRRLENTGEIVEGYGVIVTKDGKVATDRTVTAIPGAYFIVMNDGTRYPAGISLAAQGSDIAFLTPILTDAQKKDVTFTPVMYSDKQDTTLGASLLLLGVNKEISVFQGIVQNVQHSTSQSTTTRALSTKISFSNTSQGVIMGSALFSLTGEFVGMKTQSVNSDVSNDFLPARFVKDATNILTTGTGAAGR